MRRWRELVIDREKWSGIVQDRPKPAAGFSANVRRSTWSLSMCMLVESLDSLHSQAGCNCRHGRRGSCLFCCLVNLQLYQNNFWLIFTHLHNVPYCSSLRQDLFYFPSTRKEIGNKTRLTKSPCCLSQHLKQGTDFHKIWGWPLPLLYNCYKLLMAWMSIHSCTVILEYQLLCYTFCSSVTSLVFGYNFALCML
jgi:hypothetical protein